MIKENPVLALTPGEPAGVGPECTVRLAHEHPQLRLLTVADPQLLATAADALGVDIAVKAWQPGDKIMPGQINCYPVAMAQAVKPGHPDPANAAYVVETIKSAVRLVRAGHASALVTGPVHKGVINDGGIAFSGHTELLAELAGMKKVVMMLAAGSLRVALVTTHLPLRDVADAITIENVRSSLRITDKELRTRFGISDPVIQVLGLNPHAGEGGHLGHEDAQVIQKVIEECRAEGIQALGPVPADTAFTPTRLAACDAVLAMYHDQGLPVLKHAGFGKAVNITLGLPFIRTSVDHGTALDIAGKNRADASSMYTAACAAQDMCR
ncbi:MAG: 4-hydroxythreonine-4-phosphate dehydrogenase PdxA [Xanthomonadales bacterium]|nr:4-hydroxythreonine-4-phosphate dehydrogenase PdxA [Xanthomonadales bacterium]